jgi:L-serine dehydratase
MNIILCKNSEANEMDVSVFDIFKVGIGPSSSHTMGPMQAASRFEGYQNEQKNLEQITSIKIELYGSLAQTGKGHSTDRALCWGLLGHKAASIPLKKAESQWQSVIDKSLIKLNGKHEIKIDLNKDIIFNKSLKNLPHPNTLTLKSFHGPKELHSETYISIGGGHILKEGEKLKTREKKVTYPFKNGKELLEICLSKKMSIAEVVWENEKCFRAEAETKKHLNDVWKIMQKCIDRGCHSSGFLPGPLYVPKRAPQIYQRLIQGRTKMNEPIDPLKLLDWVNLYALSVNEENASGGQVVTAPTNGAAGIIPAVLHYGLATQTKKRKKIVREFLMTASAIASLYQKNASISGAEVGCQGEVGVACSMAAGALTAILGGCPEQVENAAEIAMEHNLGLTCDPVGGLVQIPCIERNAMGAVKAINASRLALQGDGKHHISLDKVIATMKQTGLDMQESYKETSRGGLAVNIIEC